MSRLYGLYVEIARNAGTPLVDPRNPVISAYPHYIDGLSPVQMKYEACPSIGTEENKMISRLFGIIAFMAPYVSITSLSNMVLLGENRNVVLEADKSTLSFGSQSCSTHTTLRVFRHDLRVYCSQDMSYDS